MTSSKFIGPKSGIWQLHEAGRCLSNFILVLFPCSACLTVPHVLRPLGVVIYPRAQLRPPRTHQANQGLKFNLIKGLGFRIGCQALWTSKSPTRPSPQGADARTLCYAPPPQSGHKPLQPTCLVTLHGDGEPAGLITTTHGTN